jgi:DNA-binding response OmpR family regulator
LPFEHYKTQVLLLHSEQSALDVFSAGFNEKYSVHCATSGTEALNTLGDTPIHVIVSAQELPGMSGLDALREAKKRSPDTIGILLAGSDKEDGLEALVGDQEVFQIVRGSVTPETLLSLVDSATQRMRLMALAESANDQAANVDEPVTEHIVMETSENGSTIISDGTSRMPALQPHKIEIAPDSGSRNVDVLLMTKDEEFLTTIKDSARGMHNVHHAVTPTQAENFARDKTVGVLVTDAAMVGSDVESLTHKLRKERPRMVAIVAGRRDDGEMLMDLINRGQVYRFLLKPVSPGRARLAIEASVKHHLEAPDLAFESKPGSASPPRKPKAKTRTKPLAKLKPAAKPKPVTEPITVIQPIPVLQPEIQPIPAAQPKARKKAEAEAKKKAEAQAKEKAEAEAKKKAEAQAKKKAEAEAEMKKQAEARKKAEAEAKKKAKAEARKKAEAEAKKKVEAEAEMKKQAEARKKEEAEARQKAAAEAKKKAEAEAQKKAEAEAEMKKQAEARKKEEAEARQKAEAKKKAEAEARKKEQAAAKMKRQADAKLKKQAEARKKEEAEARRKKEAEARKKEEARKIEPTISAESIDEFLDDALGTEPSFKDLSRVTRRKRCRHRARPLQVPLVARLRRCVNQRRSASPAARLQSLPLPAG